MLLPAQLEPRDQTSKQASKQKKSDVEKQDLKMRKFLRITKLQNFANLLLFFKSHLGYVFVLKKKRAKKKCAKTHTQLCWPCALFFLRILAQIFAMAGMRVGWGLVWSHRSLHGFLPQAHPVRRQLRQPPGRGGDPVRAGEDRHQVPGRGQARYSRSSNPTQPPTGWQASKQAKKNKKPDDSPARPATVACETRSSVGTRARCTPRLLHVLAPTRMLGRCSSTKNSASELRRRLIKTELLVGYLVHTVKVLTMTKLAAPL